MSELIPIAMLWLAYCVLHSLLASLRAKRWVAVHCGGCLPRYRLAYNALSLALLLPLLAWTARQADAPLWTWPAWVSWGAAAFAGIGFLWSMRWYDGATFLGLRQWRDGVGPDAEYGTFTISPLHRHVRHPWYALGLLWLWTRDLNPAWLVVALIVTGYLVIGSRLEERKLIAAYGEAYRAYRQRVPALIPWPGRSLSRADAEILQSRARTQAN